MSESDSSYFQTSAYAAEPVALRRPDSFAGMLMVVCGVAIGVSLLLDWSGGTAGYDVFRAAFDQAGDFFNDGIWQALVIVFGAAVLLLLGLFAFIPSRSRRALGLIAFLVAAAMTAAVLTALIDVDFDLNAFEVGFWVVIGATALGLLGALKAVLTPPKRVS